MKVLLCSVFGPYGVDNAYGRKENVMELFHNQVTREQGLFSLRYHHPSFGLHFLAANIEAPTTVLDFPSEERFVEEIKEGYDYVGISFIVPNVIKAQRMATLVREHAPTSKIILGGHGTNIPGLEQMVEHDFICRGEGVRWLRRILGEEVDRALRHPTVPSATSKGIMGIPMKSDAAALIPGVGCPNACRFCATSHFFDKRYTAYLETGRQIFDACQEAERKLGVSEFFVMDENFLKREARARELLDLMQRHDKAYTFGIFSSAETIHAVGVEFLARLGVSFLWLGVESKTELFEKNRGIDLAAMIRSLRDHGIKVLASGILFLEHHDKTTIWDDIEFVVGLDADLVQFMQLGPMPVTKLYQTYDAQDRLRKDVPYEEWHGQHRIWFDHPHFTAEESERYLRDAFRYDYDQKGSSLLRLFHTTIRGYETLRRYPDPFMARRAAKLREVAASYRSGLVAMRRFAHNARVRALTDEVIAAYDAALGPKTLKQRLGEPAALAFAAREAFRAAIGRNVYQPQTMVTPYRMPSSLAAWDLSWLLSPPRLVTYEAGSAE